MGSRLAGKVALITGASKGIGKAIAAACAAEGAAVMLSSRKQDALDAAAEEIRAATPDARLATYTANAGAEEQAAGCVAATIERLGALDILVNNAATNPVLGRTIDADLGAWDKTFTVNLRGCLVWTQSAWRSWMQEHGGSVINISSIGGISGTTTIGTYNVTKAAMIHLTKVLAAELAPGVNVNAIAPGLVKTDFAARSGSRSAPRPPRISCNPRTSPTRPCSSPAPRHHASRVTRWSSTVARSWVAPRSDLTSDL